MRNLTYLRTAKAFSIGLPLLSVSASYFNMVTVPKRLTGEDGIKPDSIVQFNLS